MQFQVPQFIEFEDKIVGPLTLKQFGYLAAAGVAAFISFTVLEKFFAVLVSAPVVGFAVAMAFAKIKGVALPKYLAAMIGFALKPQLYLWKKK